MSPDPEQLRPVAVQALTDYAGTSPEDAAAIITALLDAAKEEALDVVGGGNSLPTAVADLRAARLRRFYEYFTKRTLTRLEIQTIFRVPSSTAESIDRRMRGTFPETANSLLVKTVQESAELPKRKGSVDEGYRYEIAFRQRAGVDAAETLLERRGLTSGVKFDRVDRVVTVPISNDDKERAKRIVRDVLQLKLPE